MADLQIPQNINAKKLIKDATIGFGLIHVLSDEEEASIYQAERDIRSAQGEVRNANGEVNSAEDKQKSAETKSDDAQAKQKDGESESKSGPTKDNVSAKGNDASSIGQSSQSRSQSMTEAGQNMGQASSIFENMLGTSTERIDGFSIEISNIEQQNQSLMEQNRALVEQMQQESSFDGTGSGTNSAYSLSTATEIEEQQAQNPQLEQGGQTSNNNYQAAIDANNAQIEANGSKADELIQQTQAEQQTVETQTSEAQAQVQEQEAAAAEAQSSNESEKTTLQTIGEFAQTASNIGGTLDSVGDALKVAGVGVSAAGGALAATGGAVGITGATVTGIGAAITTVGAPLCALFGIGVPIVGAGGTTTGSGVATTTTGGTVAGTGSGLVGTGTTIQNVGNGISMVGNGLKVAGDATTAGVKIAEGDVMGAIQATANAVSSAAAFSGTIASSDKMKGVFDKVYNGASAVREGIATYQSAENGDIAGAIAHGVSTMGFGVGTSNFKYKQSVSDFSNGIAATTGAVQSAMDGDYKNAALQGTQALFNFASGVGNYKIKKYELDVIANKNREELENSQNPNEDDEVWDALIQSGDGLAADEIDVNESNSTRTRTNDSDDVVENSSPRTRTHVAGDDDDEIWDALIQSGDGYVTDTEGANRSASARTRTTVAHDDDDDEIWNALIQSGDGVATDQVALGDEHRARTKWQDRHLGINQPNDDDAIWAQREELIRSGQAHLYYHEDGTATIVSGDDADMLHAKTKNLLDKVADSEFGEGIEGLQARMIEQGARRQDGIAGINEGGGNARVRDWSGASRIGVSPELVQDAADLSQFAYGDKPGDPKRLNGWNQFDSQSADNGFHAKAFEKDGKIIIAFRGSDDGRDLVVDHKMLSGHLPDQFDNATEFVQRVRRAHPDAEIIVTGHSLGGSLTELTASRFADIRGISFDAVGTEGLVYGHEDRGLRDNRNTVNYVVRGDIISNAHEHVGTTVVVDGVRGHDEHAIQNFTGDNNALVGTEGGLASADSRRRAETEQRRARSGNTLESAIGNSNGGVVRFDSKQFKDVRSQFEIDANSLNADLDRLQRQVNHVYDPAQRAELNRILETRRKTLREDCDIARHSRVVKTSTGDEVNEYISTKGFKEPAFKPGKTKDNQTIELTSETRFVRVFNEEGNPPSFAKGVWVMELKEVEGLTPAQIKDKFALPGMPSHIVELELPAGTQLIAGPCNPVEGWGNGGGTQYFIIGEKSHKYSNIRTLPPNP